MSLVDLQTISDISLDLTTPFGLLAVTDRRQRGISEIEMFGIILAAASALATASMTPSNSSTLPKEADDAIAQAEREYQEDLVRSMSGRPSFRHLGEILAASNPKAGFRHGILEPLATRSRLLGGIFAN